MDIYESSAGKTVRQPGGHNAFIPALLNPQKPPVTLSAGVALKMSEADSRIGTLAGLAELLPSSDLFVGIYVRKEAVLSSQIENIDCTLTQVLEFEARADGVASRDVSEVVNYVHAMNYGIARLQELPLSLRLIREIHGQLLAGGRGENNDPGEFRRTQNWIGPPGANPMTASFVPPPVPEMNEALGNLEIFLHDESLPLVIQCAIAHAQFETIHPFLDGNGRIGRLLIALMLHHRGRMPRPLLYASLYLKRNRAEYYDRLTGVRRDGNWDAWIHFFLDALIVGATEAAETARKIVKFRDQAQQTARGGAKRAADLLDHLFAKPIMDARTAGTLLTTSFTTAAAALKSLEDLGLIDEITGKKRHRIYRFKGYLDLLEEPGGALPEPATSLKPQTRPAQKKVIKQHELVQLLNKFVADYMRDRKHSGPWSSLKIAPEAGPDALANWTWAPQLINDGRLAEAMGVAIGEYAPIYDVAWD